MPTGKSFRTVAGYLEGEGIFCRRIDRSETLQVAYPQLHSVTEKTKQPKDRVDILHTPGSGPLWSNAIFDRTSAVLQVFVSFLIQIMPKSAAGAMGDGERAEG